MRMAVLAGQNSISISASAFPFVFQHRPSPSLLTFKYNPQPLSLFASTNCNVTAMEETDILRGSTCTRTITTLMGLALLLMRKAAASMIPVVSTNNVSTFGALFFASVRDRASAGGALNTPLTVVAAGLGKWLDIYSGVLMVRVLLSWFPNIPWERQPLSAIRDLCDPYLNLFRNIIPPVFDTLDVSPLLAFAVLGTLGSILQTAM